MTHLVYACRFDVAAARGELNQVDPVKLARNLAGAAVVVRVNDPELTWDFAEAHRWLARLRDGTPLIEIARVAGRSPSFLRGRLQLAFLAPPIQAAILDGTQPADLTLAQILRTGVPLDWSEQGRVFGFEA